LNKERRNPRFIGDEIWRYQILLRKEEYHSGVSLAHFAPIIVNNLGLEKTFI
jgi:hypothetical protein